MFSEDVGLQSDLVRTKMLVADVAGASEHLRRYCMLQKSDRWQRGKSFNISQTVFGQLLDEYAMDQAVATALVALRHLPPEAVSRSCSPWRPPSRQYGCGGQPPGGDASIRRVALQAAIVERHEVPKRLTQFWDSEDIPGDVVDLWRAGASRIQITHTLFNDKTVQDFLTKRMPPSVLTAYRQVREAAQKADIFRLAMLALEGGVYTDADDRSLRTLDTIIPEDANLVLYQENLGSAGNNFIAAAPGHPVLVTALQAVVGAINRGDTDAIWLLSGPGLLTRALVHTAIIPLRPGGCRKGLCSTSPNCTKRSPNIAGQVTS